MPMSPRLLRPRAAGGFDPRTIGTMLAWYDFSDSSTLTMVSGFVSEIRNKSGALPNLTQGVEADRPSLGTLGGRQAGLFDGSNDVLGTTEGSATTIGAEQGVGTLVAAYSAMSSGSNRVVFSAMQGTAAALRSFAIGAASTTEPNGSARSGTATGAGIKRTVDGVSYVVSMTFTGVLPAAFRANGVDSTVVGAQFQGNTPAHVSIGARQFNNVYGLFWDAVIGEVLYYQQVLTAAQIVAAENYLRGKWGVTF